MRGSRTSSDRPRRADIGRRLADICGPRFARPAGAADEVAGCTARWVAAPGSVNAVGALLQLAAEHDMSVIPRGAGTKLDWGAAPDGLDIMLDIGRLAGVWHRPVGELTAEIGAGTPLRAVQAVLERSGQRLPIDAPSEGATIGGVVAADEAGPLRHRHGTPCQQLTEVSYVDAAGVLTRLRGADPDGLRPERAGLLCGSQGALGVLVSATMRVQQLPASRLWVSRSVWTPLEVHDLVGEILADRLAPAAIEVDLPATRAAVGSRRRDRNGPLGAGTLTVLVEGGPSDVGERVARLGRLLGGHARVAGEPPAWWRRYPFQPDDVALRIEVPIADQHAAIYALRDAAGAPVSVRGSAGLGVVHAALPGTTPPERVGEILTAVRAVLLARSGRCVVVAAPAAVREAVDLWGELPDLPTLRRVKDLFDPEHRLAPGRFTGGL